MRRFSLRRWQASNDVYIKTRVLSLDEREAISKSIQDTFGDTRWTKADFLRDDFLDSQQ